jgi:hypothetical protein
MHSSICITNSYSEILRENEHLLTTDHQTSEQEQQRFAEEEDIDFSMLHHTQFVVSAGSK